jgi:RimJ/RimL family protein N-acetyltransferase
MNADPQVMRHFPARLTSEQSDAMVDRIVAHHERYGFGLWAVDLDGRFAGFVGISTATFDAPFTPAIEIGWRLAPWAWGRGVATTTARRILQSAPGAFGVTELVSFTTTSNEPSMAVMTRIGMHRDLDGDFDHPRVDVGNPLRRHALYRWSAQHSDSGIETVPR